MLPAETRYAVHEQELLAIIIALKAWKHYLHGAQFVVQTDHKSLEYLRTQPHLSARQSRWKDIIDSFDFTIQYVEGKSNAVADELSRRSDHQEEESSTPSGELHHMSIQASLLADVWEAYKRDSVYIEEQKKKDRAPSDRFQLRGGFLFRGENRLYVPNDEALKARILHECHDSKISGHLGTEKTIERVKQRFYWPAMDKEIRRYVGTCDQCQRNKPSHQATMELMQPLPIPDRPW